MKKKIQAVAFKCKCDSVWCPECWKQRHIQYHVDQVKLFDWQNTRIITLTVNPSLFSSGKQAHEWINTHRAIAAFIRNLERGRKIKIKNWKWFLEWHKNGFPHYHLFIETQKGQAGMIGQESIHHYWLGVNNWDKSRVHETYFKSKKQWFRMVGDFVKQGYFNKKKKHQTILPKWSIEIPGLKIRRSGAVTNKKKDQVIHPKIPGPESLRPERTYKAILSECGQSSQIKIWGYKSFIHAIVSIPYKELKKLIKGHYKPKFGYAFSLSESDLNLLLDNVLDVKELSIFSDLWWRDKDFGMYLKTYLRESWVQEYVNRKGSRGI